MGGAGRCLCRCKYRLVGRNPDHPMSYIWWMILVDSDDGDDVYNKWIIKWQWITKSSMFKDWVSGRTCKYESCLTNLNHCDLLTVSAKQNTLPVYSVLESMLVGWAEAGAWNHLIIGLKQRSRVVCIWGVSDFTFSSFFSFTPLLLSLVRRSSFFWHHYYFICNITHIFCVR